MLKHFIVMISCLFSFIVLSSCSVPKEAPVIVVKHKDTEIKTEKMPEKPAESGFSYFDSLIGSYGEIDTILYIPPINEDGMIKISFPTGMPDRIEIFDSVLNEHGGEMLRNELNAQDITIKNDEVLFFVKPQWPLTNEIPEPQRVIRGFRVKGTWETGVYQYLFVIRTDAFY